MPVPRTQLVDTTLCFFHTRFDSPQPYHAAMSSCDGRMPWNSSSLLHLRSNAKRRGGLSPLAARFAGAETAEAVCTRVSSLSASELHGRGGSPVIEHLPVAYLPPVVPVTAPAALVHFAEEGDKNTEVDWERSRASGRAAGGFVCTRVHIYTRIRWQPSASSERTSARGLRLCTSFFVFPALSNTAWILNRIPTSTISMCPSSLPPHSQPQPQPEVTLRRNRLLQATVLRQQSLARMAMHTGATATTLAGN